MSNDGDASDGAEEQTDVPDWSCLLGGHRLLVIDDSLVSRSILIRILQSAGADTEEATNGYEGLALLRKAHQSQRHFDVVICDIMMPEMNGYEFLEEVGTRPEGKDVPIVMLTAKSDKDSVIFCMKHGVAGYVRKPFKQGRVIQTLRDIITRKENAAAEEKESDGA